MNTHELEDLPVLRRSLVELAEQSAPVTAVDVRGARRSAERARVRRTVNRFGAVTAAVAVGALCFTVLPSALRPGPGNFSAAPNTGPSDPFALALVPGTDPFDLSANFGWLPTGYADFGTGGSTGFQDYALALVAGGPEVPIAGYVGTFSAEYTVRIAKKKIDVTQYTFAGPVQTETVTVDGQPAVLKIGQTTENGFTLPAKYSSNNNPPPDIKEPLGLLTWKTASGDYVVIDASVPASTPDLAGAMTHVAQTLSISDASIPFPFYFRNLPSSLGAWAENGPASPPTSKTWGMYVEVGVEYWDEISVTASPQAPPSSAFIGTHMLCKVENGLHLCVSIGDGAAMPTPLAKIGLKGLLNDIVGLGTDPSTWTTEVVR